MQSDLAETTRIVQESGHLQLSTRIIEVDFEPTESSVQSLSFDENSLYKMIFPAEYHEVQEDAMVDEVFSPDGKVVRYYSTGRKEISFPSGVRRESFPDGYMCIRFEN